MKKRKKRYIVIPLILVFLIGYLVYRVQVPRFEDVVKITFVPRGRTGIQRGQHTILDQEGITAVCDYLNGLELEAAPNKMWGAGGWEMAIDIYKYEEPLWYIVITGNKIEYEHSSHLIKKTFYIKQSAVNELEDCLMGAES